MNAIQRYRISHRTDYRYPEPVAICQNQLRMLPRTFENVQCHSVRWLIQPQPDAIERHQDYYGNEVCTFSIESVHRELSVSIESEVTVTGHELPPPESAPTCRQVVKQVDDCSDLNWLAAKEFTFESPQIRHDELFADYASHSLAPEKSIVAAAIDLTKRIHQDFRYDTTATNVDTTALEAFRGKAGVCQDFAQVQVACFRSVGLPARYVSGYLRTNPPPGKPRLIGADESHAWASVYAGSKIGWIDVDPTNACFCGTSHIPLCVGRDYSEVSPMRGVVIGGGKTQLNVSVDVEEC